MTDDASVLYPWTKDMSIPREVKLEETGNAARKPKTVIETLDNTVSNYGDSTALHVKVKDEWMAWTYKEYRDQARLFAKSLLKLDIESFSTVAILGFNSPEWVFSDIGSIYAACVPFGIYTTNGSEACFFVLDDSKAKVCVVENKVQLRKVLDVRNRLPSLVAIIQYSGIVEANDDGVYDWKTFMELGSGISDEALDKRSALVTPGHCASIIYTSGTTGNPKAVMISNDSLTWVAEVVSEKFNMNSSDHIISFLPLSHIAAQLVDVHAPLVTAADVWFAQPDALKGSLGQSLKEVRPTLFLGVPRVWEKIAERIQFVGKQNGGLKKMIGSWAKKKGIKGNLNKQEGKPKPHGWWLANKLVFSKVKTTLGLDRCRMTFTGAAPINYGTLMYFLSLNIPIFEIYGLSESTALCSVSMLEQYRTGATGKAIQGTDLMIDSPDNDGNGEILIRGRNLFMGYLNLPEKTAAEFDKEGNLRTGDIGKLDGDGFLTITGRIKELIITAGGENVPPLQLESLIKETIPIVSNAMVIGDKRRYLICLLTLKCEFDEDGIPTDNLVPMTLNIFEESNIKSKTVKEAIEDTKVLDMIEQGIEQVNQNATSNAQTIRKWALLPVDFSVAGNELGPTLKMKRRVVNKIYRERIEGLYS